MIDISTVTNKLTVAGPGIGPGTPAPGGDPGGFTLALADFLKLGGPGPAVLPPLPDDAAKRQDIAGDGDSLPAGDDGADDSSDEAPTDPVLAWLPVDLPKPPVMPVLRVPTGGILSPVDPAIGKGGPKPDVQPVLPGGWATPTKPDVQPDDRRVIKFADKPLTQPTAPVDIHPDIVVKPAVFPAVSPDGTPRGIERKSVEPAKPLVQPSDVPPPPSPLAPPLTQPAGRVFAAAILAAAGHLRSTSDEDRNVATAPLAAAANAAIAETQRPIVQAAADARHAALDLRQDSGLQGMIDRIEVLRDDANARDTRIRLVPDALGAVDVAVRRDGERLQIHFTAETDATRTLLNDAQPRLAELAEARGVRIGQATVDGGATGGGSPRPPQYNPAQSIAPTRVSAAADTDSTTDQRIA